MTDVRDRGMRGVHVAVAAAFLAVSFLLAACGGAPKRPGGYYKDDGPGASPPKNVETVPDAAPRVEPLHKSANNPYTVFGRQYVPAKALRPFKQRGVASWYGKKFHGQMTSSGERYDMYAMTAAHTILPIPSYARVTNLANGKSVVVRINDRGPFHADRIIDLSYAAAYERSMTRPEWNGPRSLMRTITLRPFLRLVTRA